MVTRMRMNMKRMLKTFIMVVEELKLNIKSKDRNPRKVKYSRLLWKSISITTRQKEYGRRYLLI